MSLRLSTQTIRALIKGPAQRSISNMYWTCLLYTSIALVEEGDLIEIDVPARKLNIIGVKGQRRSMEEIDEILEERRKNWQPREPKYKKGVLRLFSQHAVSPMKGAYLE